MSAKRPLPEGDLRSTIGKQRGCAPSEHPDPWKRDNIRVVCSLGGDVLLLVGDFGVEKILVRHADKELFFVAKISDLEVSTSRTDSFGQPLFACKISVPDLGMHNVSVASWGPPDTYPTNVVVVGREPYYTRDSTYASLDCVKVVPYPEVFLFAAEMQRMLFEEDRVNTLCVRVVGSEFLVYFGEGPELVKEEVTRSHTEDDATFVIVTKSIGTLFIRAKGSSERVVAGAPPTRFSLHRLNIEEHTVTEAVIVRHA